MMGWHDGIQVFLDTVSLDTVFWDKNVVVILDTVYWDKYTVFWDKFEFLNLQRLTLL